jgi:hypothetical protein
VLDFVGVDAFSIPAASTISLEKTATYVAVFSLGAPLRHLSPLG